MAEFAKQISDLPLYQELDRAAGRDSIDATEVARLKGLVTEVADTVGPALAQIPVTFRQYTVHDIRHCRNVIARMGDILPAETREKLNALEITFLLLSALLHDVGMVVNDHEKSETLLSESFRRFKEEGHADQSKAIKEVRSAGNEPRARAIEDALLAEYYRRLHPERVRQFMDRHLSGKLRYQEVDFADDFTRLCESHAWGVEESNDARHPEKAVARLDTNIRLYGVRANLQYLACILRIADILDFDRSRTPLVVFQHLDFTEDRSWEEWNKHLQVKGWEITEKQVAFDVRCTHPVFYVAVHEFLGGIDEELRQCRYLVENKPQATADRYKLFLPQVVDRHKVRMADPSYVAGAFRFQLEYENILQLLMDKSLYPDPSLFLRELLQNALDACRRKEAAMEVAGLKKLYEPKIVVWDRSDDPEAPRIIFQDNGIGMSQRIVEQYFLRVGRSYYRSPEFDIERQRLREHGKELDASSQFGIGILSCFLVGDRFEVETYQEGFDPLHILIEGPTRYFVIRRLARPDATLLYAKLNYSEGGGPPNQPGTRITVHLRPCQTLAVAQVLESYAVNTDYPININESGRKRPRVIRNLAWERPIQAKDFRFIDGGNLDPRVKDHLPVTFEGPEKLISGMGLYDVLVSSPIPFQKWEFSSHIRGRAWFWLLRGIGGELSPRIGNLEVGLNLKVVGLPEFVAELESLYRYSSLSSYAAFFDHVVALGEDPHGWDSEEADEETKSLSSKWADLSDEEQEELREVVARRSQVARFKNEPLRFWASDPEVVSSLMEERADWADQPVSFGRNGTVGNFREDERLALHAVLVPAGVVSWSPERGIGKPESMLTLFGGSRIDVRGAKAPRPAAHRLFIPEEGIDDLRQQYLRAALRHGADLLSAHGEDASWRRWFGRLWEVALGRGLNWDLALEMDGDFITHRCPLAVSFEGRIQYLDLRSVRARAPGALPVWPNRNANAAMTLEPFDPVNQLFFPPPQGPLNLQGLKFLSLDGTTEVDVSEVPFRLLGGRQKRR